MRTFAIALSLIAALEARAQAPKPDERAEGKEAEGGPAKGLPTLEDRIRPVSGRFFTKAGRFEISLGPSLSFIDGFYNKYFGAAHLGFHFSEKVSAEVRVAGGYSQPAGWVVRCAEGTCNAPDASQLTTAPGNIPFLAAASLSYAPLYGKLNLLAERVLHFDAYVSVGPAFLLTTSGGYGAVVSVGQRYMLNRFIAVRLEVSDFAYFGGAIGEERLQQQFMFDLGVSFFLPTESNPDA